MLNREQLEKLIAEKSLIEGYVDLDTQLTPNGFDLTAESIWQFDSYGALDFSNKERVVPRGEEMHPHKDNPGDKYGWWELKCGSSYRVKTNETVNIPQDLVAFCFSRTSLLRMGAFTQHGVWDAGFRGRGEFILTVANPNGIRIKQNARVAQLVFLKMDETRHSYNGIYQMREKK